MRVLKIGDTLVSTKYGPVTVLYIAPDYKSFVAIDAAMNERVWTKTGDGDIDMGDVVFYNKFLWLEKAIESAKKFLS